MSTVLQPSNRGGGAVGPILETSGLLSARPAVGSGNGAEGFTYWATDTDQMFLSDGVGWIIVYEPKQAWVPTWNGFTVASRTSVGYYQRRNGWCELYASLTLDAALGSVASTPGLVPPFPAATHQTMYAVVGDFGVTFKFGVTARPDILGGGSIVEFPLATVNMASTYGDAQVFGTNLPLTWGVNDFLVVWGEYPMSSIYS